MGSLSLGVDFVNPKCAGLGSGYYMRFGATVLVICVLILVALFPLVLAAARDKWSVRATLNSPLGARSFRDLFVLMLLVHPGASGLAMEFFRCIDIEGVSYLMARLVPHSAAWRGPQSMLHAATHASHVVVRAQADYSLQCYDSKWLAFRPLIIVFLLVFTLGTPFAIGCVLYKRRNTLYDEDGNVIPQPLDVLYAIYRPAAYLFEPVQMMFKLALWFTLVFFEYGTEMQLGTALVVNILHLCIHLTVRPMGGKDASLLNHMQSATLAITAYITFGGFAMGYVETSKELFVLSRTEVNSMDDVATVEGYDLTITIIGFIMELLTFGLICTFGGVAIKRAVVAAREFSLEDLRTKASSTITSTLASPRIAGVRRAANRMRTAAGGLRSQDSDDVENPGGNGGLTITSGIELSAQPPPQL